MIKSDFESDLELWGAELALQEEMSQKNQLFIIYRKLALILSEGISIADILKEMGINKTEIYGYGEFGQILVKSLMSKIEIQSIYDKNTSLNHVWPGITITTPDHLINNDIPLIVTPGKFYRQISLYLMRRGIHRKKIISLSAILSYGMEKVMRGKDYVIPRYTSKKYLITGAGFHNSGAQAMLFTAVSEIRKRFSDAEIWFLPVDNGAFYTEELQLKYKLRFLTDGRDLRSELYNILTAIDAIIDVSGYVLSSQSTPDRNLRYMQTLRISINYNIPLYLMPQSFGPFEFEESINEELKKLLSNAKVVYAREQYGYDLLTTKYNLTNVKKSMDLVLQNKEINSESIYTVSGKPSFISRISTRNNVAVIPNIRNYEFGNKDEILLMYKNIISELLILGKEVYIISHSNDIGTCQDIYAMFYGHKHVHLLENRLDCLEFCKFLSDFQYLVASRFHAIVHAYKQDIPCLIVGWAEKYSELAALFNQNKYTFDVRNGINISTVLNAVKQMESNYLNEKVCISECLKKVQTGNCFDILTEGM